MIWMKNTSGKRDSMLSFAFGGFIVACVAVMVSFFEGITIGSFTLKFVTIDASHVALLTLLLGSTLTAYVTRRNNKDSHEAKKEEMTLRAQLGMPQKKDKEETEK
jgi:hypothetical protein